MSRRITQQELDGILKLYQLFLEDNNKWKCVDFRHDNLSGMDLTYSDLRGMDFTNANLSHANLTGVDLSGANLTDTNLTGANLINANLKNVIYNETTCFLALQCPEEGSFIAYKKLRDDKIAKLLISENALRSSATTRTCRANEVTVLEIQNIDNTEKYNEGISLYDNEFIYRVGETIKIDNFDTNRWNEFGEGIHFFITRQEAVYY